MAPITLESAIEISKSFAEEIAAMYPDLMAVYAIGSIGGGYYRPGQSDIDTVVIMRCSRPQATERVAEVEAVADRYWKQYNIPKGFGAIVMGVEQLTPPYIAEEELVMEIIRLKAQHKLIYGEFDLDCVPMPDKAAIIAAENAFEDWRASEGNTPPENMTRQMTVNSILILLKRWLLLEKGIVEFNKFNVVSEYLKNDPPFINERYLNAVNGYIHGGEISDELLYEMSIWHEWLLKSMNSLLLDR
ncbi:MAG: nucleotidyltransferase domain-containing protein [Clostridia bacterium]|nr:nucleotidyltransferase domain-containing protein [Clostridia bacterium]